MSKKKKKIGSRWVKWLNGGQKNKKINNTMEKKYKEIEFGLGNIESAIKVLQKYKDKNESVFGIFNGQKLFSDIDDINSAYLKITGKTKIEFDKEAKASNEKYLEEKRIHEETIPEQTKEWIEKGKSILDEKYRDKWDEIVPIRLKDLYRGLELGMCLDIIKELNSGCNLGKAKEIIEEQGHSGMSFSLVCSMIKLFSDRGDDFVSYINK
jgi:hypothetical protein